MSTRSVQLIVDSRTVLATATVADEGGYYGGTIDLTQTPARVRALFEEFEEIVNDQSFSFLDEVQEKIGALAIHAVFEDGERSSISDLQVFPSTGEISFKLADAAVRATDSG